MKELTIEEKAKAYDDALENARHYHREMGDDIKCILEECFSELKESEDERIRKAIIRVLAHQEARRFLSVDVKDCLAWLERQGKQNPFDYENANIKQKDFAPKSAMEAIKEVTVDNANKFEPKDYNSIDPHFCKPADKVEPKFNEGDWCIDNEDGIIFQVVKVLDNTYTYRTNEGEEYACTHYSLENDARLWTIEEAKDGDVLSDGTTIFIFKDLLSDGSVMSYCDYDTDSGESDAFCPLSMNLMCSKITPATKEQRDTLFKAMADARYTFDFEKKELKKIEQKSALSEEDEQYMSSALRMIEHCSFNAIGGLSKGAIIDWLKSLKDRYTWKPSDEQMKQLYNVFNDFSAGWEDSVIESLYNDLKKLTEQ